MREFKLPALVFLLLISSCKTQQDQTSSKPQPNILCLVAEDINPFLGCYGDPVAYTPNLDQLAEEGIRFTHMFSVYGVCAPSRNSLITGMYPNSIGGGNMRTSNKNPVLNIPDSLQIPPYECTPPAGIKCFTEYLRSAGYYCTNNAKEDYQFTAPKSAWDESGKTAHWRNRPEGKPFFAVFNFMRSHESQIWGWDGEPWSVHPDSVEIPPYLPDTEIVRKDIARMHTNNTIMDREMQELIDQLKEDDLLDETIIIFYSDHGGPLPRGKRELLESGTHTPFIIRFPDGYKQGSLDDELHSFVDIPPTILSLAHIRIPEYMQGQAFLGEQKAEVREYVYSARDRMDEWYDCRRAVRDKRFRYVRNYRTDIGAYLDLKFRKNMGAMNELLRLKQENQLTENQNYWFRTKKAKEELYDLSADPFELKNIASDPAYKVHLERLRQALDTWLGKIDDKGLKYPAEKALAESMWPELMQPVTKKPEISIIDDTAILQCATEGASLVYQINGQGLSENHWLLYDKPFFIRTGDTITAIAHRIGFQESESQSMIVK